MTRKVIRKPAKKPALTPQARAVVEVGSLIPDFKVVSSTGAEFKFSDLKGKRVILYFYPKDDTPGCTIEGVDFSRLLPKFKALNTVVYGISRDSVASHCRFIDKFGFKFELLSDPDELMCRLFDVIKEKNMYGKKVMGIERSTFIIDENQKLIAEYRKVKADGHAQAMLDSIKAL